jgi:hypothetical protein
VTFRTTRTSSTSSLSAALAAFALAACGGNGDGLNTVTVPQSRLTENPIVLESAAGRQDAAVVPCASSLSDAEEAATEIPICLDANPALRPAKLSVVRPGETVTVSLPGAEVTNPPGCSITCSSVQIQPLECRDTPLGMFELEDGPATEWTVDLAPGRYELEVYARFRSDDGQLGIAQGKIGLVVDVSAEQTVTPVQLEPCER